MAIFPFILTTVALRLSKKKNEVTALNIQDCSRIKAADSTWSYSHISKGLPCLNKEKYADASQSL